ncbi:MAG TPA: ROK family transcriptional regulator [Solirubrobacteraceae bacterium]|nr:ROK family transcriptional regulator [Solirubrobacteraceae bacterium]
MTDGALSEVPRPRLNLLRELSEQAVLETIFRDGPITRPEIATRTSLSKPTVSEAVGRLVAARLVHPTGERSGRRGRAPMAYAVNRAAGFVVGVDVGGTNLRVAASDIYGEIVAQRQERTSKDGARAVAEQLTDLVRDAVAEAVRAHGKLLAVGLSTPGVVDPATKRVTSLAFNVAPEGGFDPLEVLGGRFDAPVLVENNVNLAAVGERWRGLAKTTSTFVFVSVGAGVGMGIVVEDELVRGAHGAAGEIGYLPLTTDPFDRRHVLRGGLEDEVGAAGILEALPDADWDGDPPQSVQEVFELSLQGHSAAQRAVENAARHIGLAIATVCAVMDPALVVLGGGIGSNAVLLPQVRSTVASLVPLPARIETSLLGEQAALYGAISIALRAARQQLFSQGRTGAAAVGG